MAEGLYQSAAAYVAHNKKLIEEVKSLQAKLRRQDLLVDVQSRFEFFDRRVPQDVCNGAGLDKWLESESRQNPRVLHMEIKDLLSADVAHLTPQDFPDHITSAGLHLKLHYRVDPAHPLDGVTVTLPMDQIERLDPDRLDWLVPGYFLEKVVELLRTLPADFRKRLVPAPQFAADAASAIPYGKGNLLAKLSDYFSDRLGETIPLDAWKPAELPGYLRINIRVVDNRNNQVAIGKDLREIRDRLRDKAQANLALLPKDHFNRDGMKTWEFPDLPERVEISREAITAWAYPALVEQTNAVGLRLMDNKALAEQSTRKGLARLFLHAADREARAAAGRLPGFDGMAIIYASLGDRQQLRDDILMAACDLCFLEGQPIIRTRAAFDARLKSEKHRLDFLARDIALQTGAALKAFQQVALQLSQPMPANWEPAIKDVKVQLAGLLPKGFIRSTPHDARPDLARYIAAASARIRKLANGGITRDQKLQQEMAGVLVRYAQIAKDHVARGIVDPELTRARWMIEEYRVSLFAQELGTRSAVSTNRVLEQLDKTRRD
jgi:ATP-dependent helicase HrpA